MVSPANRTFYPVFEPNDLLTARRLNDVVNYLAGEAQASRSCLGRAGILFGLEVQRLASVTQTPCLRLLPGAGLTSAGDLISFPTAVEYRFAKELSVLPPYAPAQKEWPSAIRLWELFTEQGDGSAAIDQVLGDTSDTVIMLFIESSLSGGVCDPIRGSEESKVQESRVRTLAFKTQDITDTGTQSLHQSETEPYCYFKGGSKLPQPLGFLEHVSLRPTAPFGISHMFGTAVNTGLLNRTLQSILDAVTTYCSLFEITPYEGRVLSVLKARAQMFVNTNSTIEDPFWVQAYAWLRDVERGFYEFCVAVAEVEPPWTQTSAGPFPRHLLLGSPVRVAEAGISKLDVWRHPITGPSSGEGRARARWLLKRLVTMLDGLALKLPEGLSVTADLGPTAPLGSRSIPRFYASPDTIEAVWNYEAGRNGWNPKPAKLEWSSQTLDKCSFFRIEGHLGRSLVGQGPSSGFLAELRGKFSALPFQVAAVSLTNRHAKLSYQDVGVGFSDRTLWTVQEFIARYRGCEPLGGVSRGGTFVLVCDNNMNVVADFCLSESCRGDSAVLGRLVLSTQQRWEAPFDGMNVTLPFKPTDARLVSIVDCDAPQVAIRCVDENTLNVCARLPSTPPSARTTINYDAWDQLTGELVRGTVVLLAVDLPDSGPNPPA